MARATASDLRHFNAVASLGCIICQKPAEIHHINSGGMGMKSGNREVIPLCHEHHRTGGHGVAVHAGKRTWEANFGTERELLERVRDIL